MSSIAFQITFRQVALFVAGTSATFAIIAIPVREWSSRVVAAYILAHAIAGILVSILVALFILKRISSERQGGKLCARDCPSYLKLQFFATGLFLLFALVTQTFLINPDESVSLLTFATIVVQSFSMYFLFAYATVCFGIVTREVRQHGIVNKIGFSPWSEIKHFEVSNSKSKWTFGLAKETIVFNLTEEEGVRCSQLLLRNVDFSNRFKSDLDIAE